MSVGIATVVFGTLLIATMPGLYSDASFGFVLSLPKATVTVIGFTGMLVGLAWMWRIYSRLTDE